MTTTMPISTVKLRPETTFDTGAGVCASRLSSASTLPLNVARRTASRSNAAVFRSRFVTRCIVGSRGNRPSWLKRESAQLPYHYLVDDKQTRQANETVRLVWIGDSELNSLLRQLQFCCVACFGPVIPTAKAIQPAIIRSPPIGVIAPSHLCPESTSTYRLPENRTMPSRKHHAATR